MRSATLVILPVALVVVGCAGRQRPVELDEDVRGYGEGLRWGRLAEAAGRIPPRERGEFLIEREELADDLRIGDWEIERVEWQEPDRRATVTVRWTWHLDSRGIVHRTTTEQRWQRSGKRWQLLAEVRRRGEPMPGVPEARRRGEPVPGTPEARARGRSGDELAPAASAAPAASVTRARVIAP
jgi:hypothetical protein